MLIWPHLVVVAIALTILVGAGFYVYKYKSQIDEMHGMMIGMTFGMLTGLVVGSCLVMPTGNFLMGIIVGSLAGLMAGIPFGKLGGHLGIMEGIMAGPMGGMMGAMLGQMIRPFDASIFMPFFIFIFLITAIGITYAVECKSNCCVDKQPNNSNQLKTPSDKFIAIWSIISVFFLIISFTLPFGEQKSENQTTNSDLPPSLQALINQNAREEKTALVKNNYQEIDLKIKSASYSPNVIKAKQGLPLKINITAEDDAGCGQEIVFPDFGIDKIISAGTSGVIELTPIKTGTFAFRCSMDMIKGELVVER